MVLEIIRKMFFCVQAFKSIKYIQVKFFVVVVQRLMLSASLFMCYNRFIHISSDYQASFRGKQRTGNA